MEYVLLRMVVEIEPQKIKKYNTVDFKPSTWPVSGVALDPVSMQLH